MDKQFQKIKKALDKLYAKYNHCEFIKPDPLQFVYQYRNRGDMEIAGFLAAGLAYGAVRQIEKSVTGLLAVMGESPFEFVRNFGKAERKKLNGFKHRFNTGRDISDLLSVLKKVLKQQGSIEEYFVSGYDKNDPNIIKALSKFCSSLLEIHAKDNGGNVPQGLAYLLPNPSAGSACKRLNLFLRWMIRDDEVDAGLWKSVDKAKLVVPVDVHIGRLCRILKLYTQKSVSIKAAVEITESFAKMQPADPVKYDFALSRIGILENCSGRLGKNCERCELFTFCKERQD